MFKKKITKNKIKMNNKNMPKQQHQNFYFAIKISYIINSIIVFKSLYSYIFLN